MTPFRVALLLATLCGVAAWQVSVIPESLMQMTVGPVLAPGVKAARATTPGMSLSIPTIARRRRSNAARISSTADRSPLTAAIAALLAA